MNAPFLNNYGFYHHSSKKNLHKMRREKLNIGRRKICYLGWFNVYRVMYTDKSPEGLSHRQQASSGLLQTMRIFLT